MKWLVTISSSHETGYPTEVYDFHADDEEAATEKALKCYRKYVYNTCQDFDKEEDLPIVLLYKLTEESIWVDVFGEWKAERQGVLERRAAAVEKQEREMYERLQKKFGK